MSAVIKTLILFILMSHNCKPVHKNSFTVIYSKILKYGGNFTTHLPRRNNENLVRYAGRKVLHYWLLKRSHQPLYSEKGSETSVLWPFWTLENLTCLRYLFETENNANRPFAVNTVYTKLLRIKLNMKEVSLKTVTTGIPKIVERYVNIRLLFREAQ